MRLYEKWRPQTFADMVGNPKAVNTLAALCKQGIGGRALWLSGPSGAGKTTAARIASASIADPKWATVEVDAGAVSPDDVRQWSMDCHKYGWGIGGRAWIINEAHGLRAATIRALLVWLEELPDHCVVVFTTTAAGEDKLFDDQMDASPLLSRCITVSFTNQGLAQAFAERARTIAVAEGLDGQPPERYLRLARDRKSNMRAMLQDIEAGALTGGAA